MLIKWIWKSTDARRETLGRESINWKYPTFNLSRNAKNYRNRLSKNAKNYRNRKR